MTTHRDVAADFSLCIGLYHQFWWWATRLRSIRLCSRERKCSPDHFRMFWVKIGLSEPYQRRLFSVILTFVVSRNINTNCYMVYSDNW